MSPRNFAEFIHRETNFKVSIICTGAAIGFLTGTQAPINSFLDQIYLGWLIRLIFDPKNILQELLNHSI